MRYLVVLGFVGVCLLLLPLLVALSVLPERRRLHCIAHLTQFFAKRVLALFRIKLRERPHDESLPSPRVIIANHVSYMDIPVLLSRVPCTFMAKKEVAAWPIIGPIARRLGVVFVDRGCLWHRAQSMLEIQKRLQMGLNVVIFPEGTTTDVGPRRGVTPFHAGAFRVARMESVPIEVVYIDYDDLERCAWLGDDPFVPHLLRIYHPQGIQISLRTKLIDPIPDRRSQREAREYCRNYLLLAGHIWGPDYDPANICPV